MRPGRLRPLAAAALVIGGCGGGGDEDETLNQTEAAKSIERIATAAPVEKPDLRPKIEPIAAAELQRELRGGAGCVFSTGDRLLFAATAGDAVAKVNGRIVHFAAAAPVGPTGGFFTGGAYSLSVGRTVDAAKAADETRIWPGRIAVTDRSKRDRPLRELRGTWRCGA